jgi:oligoribonuclease (3'-5' exoribonuclease)
MMPLVEIAVLVTDAQLNVLGEGVDLVIKCDPAKLDQYATGCNRYAY